METTAAWLMTVGGLGILMSFLLGVIELATLGAIRPPKRQTFTYIRLAAAQYQTVVLPTLGRSFQVCLSVLQRPSSMEASLDNKIPGISGPGSSHSQLGLSSRWQLCGPLSRV